MQVSNDILSLIPQRHPFVMIDELLFIDESITQTSFFITSENVFCEEEHFSEAGLLENMAQTVAAGSGFKAKQKNKTIPAGYIGAVKNFEVLSLPEVNNILITETVVTYTIFNMINIKGKITCNQLLIAQCEMKVFINDAE